MLPHLSHLSSTQLISHILLLPGSFSSIFLSFIFFISSNSPVYLSIIYGAFTPGPKHGAFQNLARFPPFAQFVCVTFTGWCALDGHQKSLCLSWLPIQEPRESAPEPAAAREPTGSAPESAPLREPTESEPAVFPPSVRIGHGYGLVCLRWPPEVTVSVLSTWLVVCCWCHLLFCLLSVPSHIVTSSLFQLIHLCLPRYPPRLSPYLSSRCLVCLPIYPL